MGCIVKHKTGTHLTEDQARAVYGAEQRAEKAIANSPLFTKHEDGSIVMNRREGYETVKMTNSAVNASVITVDEHTWEVTIDGSILKYRDEHIPPTYTPVFKPFINEMLPASQQQKLDILQAKMPEVLLIVDNTRTTRVLGSNTPQYKQLKTDRPVISINMDTLKSDSLFHEYGHIYIDSLIQEGYGSIIDSAINQLKDTDIWNTTKNKYPDLTEEQFQKEVLTTAIGLEADKLNSYGKLRGLVDRILEALSRLLGIPTNQIKSLARDLVLNETRIARINAVSGYDQEQRSKTQQDTIDRINEVDALIHANFDPLSREPKGIFIHKNPSETFEYSNDNRPKNAATRSASKGHEFKADDEAFERAKQHILKNVYNYSEEQIAEFIPSIMKRADPEMVHAIEAHALEIQEKWRTSAIVGTNIHKIIEDMFNGEFTSIKDYLPTGADKEFLARHYENNVAKLQKLVTDIRSKALGTKAVVLTERKIYDPETDTVAIIDLMLVYPDGTVDMYDFKTSTSSPFNLSNDIKISYKQNKLPVYAKQLMIEKRILEKSYGIMTNNLNIVPIQIGISENNKLNDIKIFDRYINVEAFPNSNRWMVEVYRDLIPNLNNPLDWKLLLETRIASVLSDKVHAEKIKKFRNSMNSYLASVKHETNGKIDTQEIYKLKEAIDRNMTEDGFLMFIGSLNRIMEKVAEEIALINFNSPDVDISKMLLEFNNTLAFFESVSEFRVVDFIDPDLTHILNDFNYVLIKLQDQIKNKMKERLVDILLRSTSRGLMKYKVQYREDFIANNPNGTIDGTAVSNKDYEIAEKQYIDRKLRENSYEIYQDRLQYFNFHIDNLVLDTSEIQAWLSGAEINDDAVKAVDAMYNDLISDLNQKELNINKSYEDVAKSIMNEAFTTEHNFGKYVAMHDGKLSEYFMSEYDPSFMINKEIYYNEIIAPKKQRAEQIREDMRKAKTDLEKVRLEGDLTALLKDIDESWRAWFAANTEKLQNGNTVPRKSLYQTPEYLDRLSKVKDTDEYRFMISELKGGHEDFTERDEKKSKESAVQEPYEGVVFYRIPSNPLTARGRLFSNRKHHYVDIWNTDTNRPQFPTQVKDWWKDLFYNKRVDDTDVGNVSNVTPEGFQSGDRKHNTDLLTVGTDGAPINIVPTRLAGYIGETRQDHLNNLSYNLIENIKQWRLMTYEYNKRVKVINDVELIYTAYKNVIPHLNKKNKTPINNNGRLENTHIKKTEKATKDVLLRRFINDRFYNIKIEDGWVKAHKLVKSIVSGTTFRKLAQNIPSGGTNVLSGLMQLSTEYVGVENQHISKLIATRYLNDIRSITADLGRVNYNSMTNLLMEFFRSNHSQDVNLLNAAKSITKLGFRRLLKRHLNTETLMTPLSLTEHAVTALTTYAELENMYVTNERGEYLDKDFNVTDTPSLKFIDTIKKQKINKATRLVFDDRVKYTSASKRPLNNGGISDISKKINARYMKTQGHYDAPNKPIAYNKLYALVLGQLKGWMVSYGMRRYRGITTSTMDRLQIRGLKRDEDGKIQYDEEHGNRIHFNEALQEESLATYVEMIRFGKSILDKAKEETLLDFIINFRKSVKNEFKLLTATEKKVLRTARKDIYRSALITFVNVLLYNILDEEEPEEDKKKKIKNMVDYNKDEIKNSKKYLKTLLPATSEYSFVNRYIKKMEKQNSEAINHNILPNATIYSTTRASDKIGFQWRDFGFDSYKYIVSVDNNDFNRRLAISAAVLANRLEGETNQLNFLNFGSGAAEFLAKSGSYINGDVPNPMGNIMKDMSGALFTDVVSDFYRLNSTLSPAIDELYDMKMAAEGIFAPDYYIKAQREKGGFAVNKDGKRAMKGLRGHDKALEATFELGIPGYKWWSRYDESIQSQVQFINQ